MSAGESEFAEDYVGDAHAVTFSFEPDPSPRGAVLGLYIDFEQGNPWFGRNDKGDHRLAIDSMHIDDARALHAALGASLEVMQTDWTVAYFKVVVGTHRGGDESKGE